MFPHHSSDSSEVFTALRRHDEYYLSGGDLFFLIEQNHFRVHRYFFERESPFFKAQLATPASPGAPRQGTSESTAIVLDNVKSADFAKFLWVFYNPKYSLYKATVDDWVAILELATRWGFQEVKNLAVRELQRLDMSDLDRIVVYHKYDIDRGLLIPCYAALCAREAPLSLEEGMALGMDTTLKIFRAREIARAAPAADGTRSPSPIVIPAPDLKGIVKDLFEVEEPTVATSPVDAVATAPPPKSNSKVSPPPSKKGPLPPKTPASTADSISTQKKAESSPWGKKPESSSSSEVKPETKPASSGGLVLPTLTAHSETCSVPVTPAVPTAPPILPKALSPMELSPLPLSPLPLPIQPPKLVSLTELRETDPQTLAPEALTRSRPQEVLLPLAVAVEVQQRRMVNKGIVDVDGENQTLETDSDDDTRVGSCSSIGDNEHDIFHDDHYNVSYGAPKDALPGRSFEQRIDDNTRVGGRVEVDFTETALDAAHGQSTAVVVSGVNASVIPPPEDTLAEAMNAVRRPIEADDTDQTSYGLFDEMKAVTQGSANNALEDQSSADDVSNVALDAVSHNDSAVNTDIHLNASSISGGNTLDVLDRREDLSSESVGQTQAGCDNLKELAGLPAEGVSAASADSKSSANPPSSDDVMQAHPSNMSEGVQDTSPFDLSAAAEKSNTEPTDNDASSSIPPSSASNGIMSGMSSPAAEDKVISQSVFASPLFGTAPVPKPNATTFWTPGANIFFQPFGLFGLSDTPSPFGKIANESILRPVTDPVNLSKSNSEPEPATGCDLLSPSTLEFNGQVAGEAVDNTVQSSIETQDLNVTGLPTDAEPGTGKDQTNGSLDLAQIPAMSQSSDDTSNASSTPPEVQGDSMAKDCPPRAAKVDQMPEDGSVQTEEPAAPQPTADNAGLSEEQSEVQNIDNTNSQPETASDDSKTNDDKEESTILPTGGGGGLPPLEKPALWIKTVFSPQREPATIDDQTSGAVQTEGPTDVVVDPFEDPFNDSVNDKTLPSLPEHASSDDQVNHDSILVEEPTPQPPSDDLDSSGKPSENGSLPDGASVQYQSEPASNGEQAITGSDSESSQLPTNSSNPLDVRDESSSSQAQGAADSDTVGTMNTVADTLEGEGHGAAATEKDESGEVNPTVKSNDSETILNDGTRNSVDDADAHISSMNVETGKNEVPVDPLSTSVSSDSNDVLAKGTKTAGAQAVLDLDTSMFDDEEF